MRVVTSLVLLLCRDRGRLAMLPLAILTLGLAGCGGSKSSTPVSPTPTPTPPVATAPEPPRSTENPATATTNFDGFASMSIANNPGANSAVYDDFTLTAATTIRTLSWQGIYCTPAVNAPNPVPTATAFVVAFYPSDSGGGPNSSAPLQQVTVPVANVAQTLEQNRPGGTCSNAAASFTPTPIGTYNYALTLPTPFSASAGTRYWLSIVANVPSTPPTWAWRSGTQDNGVSFLFFQNNFTTLNRDRAFALRP